MTARLMEEIHLPRNELVYARAAAERFGANDAAQAMQELRWWRVSYDTMQTGRVQLTIESYAVLSRTPKGVWIDCDGLGVQRKWVSATATKRYCYPTREEALESFIRRKQRHVLHATRQLKNIEQALHLAQQPEAKYNLKTMTPSNAGFPVPFTFPRESELELDA